MGIRGGVAILAVCLGLAGCSLFGKKPATPAARGPASSDVAPPTFPSAGDRVADNNPTPRPSQTNGFLAGQIKDGNNRLSGGALIQVVDLEDTREPKSAPIERQADDQGYFRIEGLRPNGHYQLIARLQDGDRAYAGVLVATAPNPRLTIWVREDPAGALIPNAPARPTYPGKPDGARGPAASLDQPVREGAAPNAAGKDVPPAAGNASGQSPAPDLRRTVDGGFQQTPRPPVANVPGPDNSGLPAPPGSPKPDDPARPINQPTSPAPAATPAPGPTSQAPADNAPVPFCQLVGKKLINLALYDCEGRVWEYRKNRAGRERIGRLTLVEFWCTHCGPCLAATPRLVELNHTYWPYGLDVVGIAYESGTMEQRIAQVRSVRGRYGIRYPTLLGDGVNCPVRAQFNVQAFPTVFLLDENGVIISCKEGLDSRSLQELELEIRRGLGIR